MKQKRRTFLRARAALRLGAAVVLSCDREVIVEDTFIGKIGIGQAYKLEKMGAVLDRNAMWRDSVKGGHLTNPEFE